ncbi:hypothetical protein GPLA_4370 [Paraglaciecola polaris LMG 21857]|uniref:YecA family protein n=2 Tax=Paraglaciecola polaris TaxID=222814 RepID=K6YR96_9ALTE|nr:UPF0149 family protein [Paraglaciecola polaris]GAC35249.1 hypothetical protein GPLA_4370 [Paraglaciecola polaris LMG 21857]
MCKTPKLAKLTFCCIARTLYITDNAHKPKTENICMTTNEFSREQELNALCQSDELSRVLFSVDYLKGLVFAVASSPEIPMPEVWLPWIFRQHGQIPDTDTADKLTDLLMAMLQHQLRLMRDNLVTLDKTYVVPQQAHTLASNTLPLSQWCSGVLAGHSELESVWNNAWFKMQKQHPQNMDLARKNLSHCLTMLSTFADLPLAYEQAIERQNAQQFVALLPTVFLSLEQALKTYVGLSGQLVEYLPNQFETFSQPAGSSKL